MENEINKTVRDEGTVEKQFNWMLVRSNDNKTLKSKDVLWLEFNTDGTFKRRWDKPATGRSLIMSPFNEFFTWQTTDITEIIKESEDEIIFNTKNSTYTLTKIP